MTPTSPASTTDLTRIDRMFAERRAAGRAAMIFYITAGFPDLATTERVIDALVEAGADLIELGIPFSDPIADGPTIQQASFVALENGVTVPGVLECAGRIRERHPQLPILFFSAYNPIFHYGDQAFVKEAARVGIDALLVPDLPPEAAAPLQNASAAEGLNTVFLVAPTTTPERAAMICAASSGFIYYISLKGVTGARAELPPDLEQKVTALKQMTDKPVAVGFGVSSPAQAAGIARFADGVIVGSALIREVAEGASGPDLHRRIVEFARPLCEAMRR